MRQRIPAEITHLYGHQEEAIRAIHAGRTTLVSTGTGSGKTECFLYPIVSKCLELRDDGDGRRHQRRHRLPDERAGRGPARAPALAAGRHRHHLRHVRRQDAGERERGRGHPPAARVRRAPTTRPSWRRRARRARSETVYPPEEVCSREVMRTPGGQPRILLTNVKQLELLLTRQRDVELFAGARLDFLVFDEAHTFTGAQGAETACLIRRLRAFCGRDAARTRSAWPRRRPSSTRRTRTPRASSRRASSACPRTTWRRSARRTSARCGRTTAPCRRRRPRIRRRCSTTCRARRGGRCGTRRARSASVYRRLAGADLPDGDVARGALRRARRATSSSSS